MAEMDNIASDPLLLLVVLVAVVVVLVFVPLVVVVVVTCSNSSRFAVDVGASLGSTPLRIISFSSAFCC